MPRKKPTATILGNNNKFIVGQQQIPKIFGKKLVLLDPSNASFWIFSNVLALLSQFLG